jgi:hypothetical protein
MAAKPFRLIILVAFVVLLFASGCAKTRIQNETVEGTLKLDGTPVPNVLVEFVPDDPKTQFPPSSGLTDDKGHFQLMCDNQKSGAVIGKHNVVIQKGRNERGTSALALAIPDAYTMALKTPLQVEVTATEHNYDLNLSRNPPARKQ